VATEGERTRGEGKGGRGRSQAMGKIFLCHFEAGGNPGKTCEGGDWTRCMELGGRTKAHTVFKKGRVRLTLNLCGERFGSSEPVVTMLGKPAQTLFPCGVKLIKGCGLGALGGGVTH